MYYLFIFQSTTLVVGLARYNLNPGLRSEKPASSRLSYSTALRISKELHYLQCPSIAAGSLPNPGATRNRVQEL
jgi:hypothetical protein